MMEDRNVKCFPGWKAGRPIEYRLWVLGIGVGVFFFGIIFALHFLPGLVEKLRFDCWIYKENGLFCPGCGGTRAFISILNGQIWDAFCYHPVVPYTGILYFVYMIRGAIAVWSKGRFSFMKWRISYVYIGIGIVLVQFVVKNAILLL